MRIYFVVVLGFPFFFFTFFVVVQRRKFFFFFFTEYEIIRLFSHLNILDVCIHVYMGDTAHISLIVTVTTQLEKFFSLSII